MNEQKSLLTHLSEALDRYRTERYAAVQEPAPKKRRGWLRWLGRQMAPNIGTLLMVVVLLLTIPSLAAPLIAPSATSTSTISYQGRLADSEGNPLTDFHTMEFRIYDVPTGGTPLWEEFWTGANSVAVSDGLFNVMLGSINNTLAESIEGYDELYLGITVDTDSEMVPRVQLGSVPFSMQALTVPDGSITTGKIADEAVTQAKLGSDISLEPPDGSITTEKIADGAVTTAKLDLQDALTIQDALTVDGTIDSSTNVLLRYATVTTDADGQASAGVAYVAVLKPAHIWNASGNYWETDYDFNYNSNVGSLSGLPANRKVVIYYVRWPGGQGNPVNSPPDW